MAEVWRPLLDGEAAAAARATAEAVIRAVAEMPDDVRLAPDVLLLLAYGAAVIEGPWLDDATGRWLDVLAGQRDHGGLGLHGGLAGMGFTLAHVTDDGADGLLGELDELLLTHLAEPHPLGGHFDLISGVVGIGVYFLERRAAAPAVAAAGVASIVEALAASVRRDGDGAHWRRRAPDGTDVGPIDCGLAHGVPGVLALLARIVGAGLGGPCTRDLLDDTCRWTAAQARGGPGARFPYAVADEVGWAPARTAWCYGDPGVALSLYGAALATGAELAAAQALDVLDAACSRAPDTALVRDASLCHGAMGLAHVANRVYQASGEHRFAEHARRWLAHGLTLHQPMQPLGGFPKFDPRVGALVPSSSLLEGAAGAALALVAAIEEAPPCWDRLLLCELPQRP